MLKITDISYSYKFNDFDHSVLRNACLTLHKGQMAVLLGPSGSGKSTLAKIIAGLVMPDKGSIVVNDSSEQNGSWNRIGYVFQNADSQTLGSDVYSEIICGPLNVGIPLKEARAITEELIVEFGLEKVSSSKQATLSGGERQKVAIAAIVAMQPSYLLLDEPTAMLDDSSVANLFNYLRRLKSERNAGILVITQKHALAKYADVYFGLDNLTVTSSPYLKESIHG